jgi:hypothetical protein
MTDDVAGVLLLSQPSAVSRQWMMTDDVSGVVLLTPPSAPRPRLELDAVPGFRHAVVHRADQGLQLGHQARLVRGQHGERGALEVGAHRGVVHGVLARRQLASLLRQREDLVRAQPQKQGRALVPVVAST